MLWILLFALSSEPESCMATKFGYPGDKHAGGNALYLKRPVNSRDVGIAHRTLPLGSWVLVSHGDRAILAQVIDRGPYGAMHRGKWRVKKRRSQPGRWRGCADLTSRAAELLEHDGWGRVKIWRVSKPRGKPPRRRAGV